jgi:hypothetical protein
MISNCIESFDRNSVFTNANSAQTIGFIVLDPSSAAHMAEDYRLTLHLEKIKNIS